MTLDHEPARLVRKARSASDRDQQNRMMRRAAEAEHTVRGRTTAVEFAVLVDARAAELLVLVTDVPADR